MKKALLVLIILGVFTSAKAQNCIPGYNSNYIYDDFSSATELINPDSSGIYFQNGNTGGFSSTLTRNTVTGKLDVVLTQPYGQYSPFNLNFGLDTVTGKQFTLDMTSNKTFDLKLKNTHPDSTFTFKMALLDSLGNQIDTYLAAGPSGAGLGNCDNSYLYYTQLTLAPGETKAFTAGTYAGGYYADYNKTAPQASGTSGTNCWLKNNLNFSIVSALLFFVTNSNQNAADGYKPYTLNNVSLSIDYVKLGACVLTNVNSNKSALKSSKLYPNPCSDLLNVELNLEAYSDVKISVADLLGKEVLLKTGKYSDYIETLDVSALNKGVYSISYQVNGQMVKSELLLIK